MDKYVLRETCELDYKTNAERKDYLKGQGLLVDEVEEIEFKTSTKKTFLIFVSTTDKDVVLLLNNVGQLVAATGAYRPDHAWDLNDSAEYEEKTRDKNAPVRNYLSAGFISAGKLVSLFDHPKYLEREQEEKVGSEVYIDLMNEAEDEIKTRKEAKENEEIGGMKELINEVLAKEEAVEDKDVGVEEEFVRIRSRKIEDKRPLRTFMNREAAYTMYDYMSVIKRVVDKDEWILLKEFMNMDPTKAKLLAKLQARFNFCEVCFEDNERTSAAYIDVNNKGGKHDAVAPKEFATADQLNGRLPQAGHERELVYEPQHMVREGELKPYVNLYDVNRKIYYTSTPKQPVPYAAVLSKMTNYFSEFAISRNSSYAELVPKTNNLLSGYTDMDFEIMADIAISSRANDPGTISIIFNTIGGNLYGDLGGERVCKIGPLARIMGEGIPPPFKLQAAYQYDKEFADYWDSCVARCIRSRQSHLKNEYARWKEAMFTFHSSIECKRGVIYFAESPSQEPTELQFDEMVSELHEINRAAVEGMSMDRAAFMMFYHRINPFGNEMMGPMILNDSFFDKHNLDIVNAGDLVNVGYCTSCKGARMPDFPGEDVTMKDPWLDKFDINLNSLNGLIDMRLVHGKLVLIGGGSWEEKITVKPKDKRNPIYYDYEPVRSRYENNKGFHTPVSLEDDQQYQHAIKQLSLLGHKYDTVGVLTSVRSLPIIIKKYHIVAIYPAPFPAVMSAYVIGVAKRPKLTVTFTTAYDMVYMMYCKVDYMFAIYKYGAKDLIDLINFQIDLETHEQFQDILAAWYVRLVKRFRAGEVKTTNMVIKDSMDRLLRVDNKFVSKANINAGKARSDYVANSFKLNKKRT